MFKWFRDCKTAEQGKQLYHELVRKFHPDNGGCGEEIKEKNTERVATYRLKMASRTKKGREKYDT